MKSIRFGKVLTGALLAAGSITMATACSSKSDSSSAPKATFDSGIPSIDGIVAESTPSGLTTLPAMAFAEAKEIRLFTAITSYATFKDWIVERFFNNCEETSSGCSGATYYRRYTKQLDDTVTALENRFEETPSCFAGDATNANKATLTINGQAQDFYFSCWETISGGSGTQKAAYGRTASHFYLLKMNEADASNGMAMLAKADRNGNNVEIWSLAKAGTDRTVIRAFADKSARDMSYYFGTTQLNDWNNLCHFFGRTDGTSLYFNISKGDLQPSPACETTGLQVPGGVADAGEGCVLADDIDTAAAAGGCASIDEAPTGFVRAIDHSTNLPSTAEIDAILDFDLTSIAQQLP